MKTITLIILSFLGQFICGCSDNSNKTNFPTHIYIEKISPDKKTNAIIYSWSNGNKFDFLGSDDRFSLGFTNKKSKWFIDFELSEGFGTYEGGITGIEWLNNSEVLIKRRVSDSQKDIKYNIRNNEWTLVDVGEDKN
jgi:hypothetical protein